MHIQILLGLLVGICLLGFTQCLPRETTCKCFCNGTLSSVVAADSDTVDAGTPIAERDDAVSGPDDVQPDVVSAEPNRPEQTVTLPTASKSYTEPNCTGELRFKDPKLTLVVRRRLKRATGPIFAEDVASWTELTNEAGNGTVKVTDLSGIECFRALERISFTNTRITDLTPISRLVNLRELTLTNGGVSRIDALLNLPKLTKLELINHQLSDLKPLTKMKQLEYLQLSGNQISDVSPLLQKRQLKFLSLAGNRITRADALAKLTQLTDLALGNNNIRDIRFVKKLSNLTYLSLDKNGLSDIRPLSDALPNLDYLDLNGNPIVDFEPLTHTLGGGRLDISNIKIDCDKQTSVLDTLSIRWTEMYIDCPDFFTGV